MCVGEEIYFPQFAKGCSFQDECALVFHTIDCCGTDVAWGIHVDEVQDFEAAESICDGQYPECGCPPGPTEAEDGNSTLNLGDIAVACIAEQCESLIP
jgi:hypothetical protein